MKEVQNINIICKDCKKSFKWNNKCKKFCDECIVKHERRRKNLISKIKWEARRQNCINCNAHIENI